MSLLPAAISNYQAHSRSCYTFGKRRPSLCWEHLQIVRHLQPEEKRQVSVSFCVNGATATNMSDICFMVKSVSSQKVVVRRNAAIGDCVAALCVIDKLLEQGFDPVYQTHPAMHCVLRRHPKLQHFEEPKNGNADVVLDGSYEKHPLRRSLHFSSIFMHSANEQLARLGINLGPAVNCRPSLRVHPSEKAAAQAKFSQYPKPWVFVCPRSDAYAARQVPDGIWSAAAEKMNGTVFWLGRHPAPPHFVDLHCQHLDNVIIWLSAADLLVTVDTGPLHLAAALGIPILALGQSSSPDLHLSDQRDFITINPKGLDCLNCQKNICPINPVTPPCQNFDPEFIAQWTNAKLRQITDDRVSAVVPIYQPKAETLNKCLEHILPQVSEVIVCEEGGNSRLPSGAMRHPKIRYISKGLRGIGVGKNYNFGARHTTGKYLMMLNDDVFMAPGAVDLMKAQMVGNVGCVTARLMYPDDTVYFAGKIRTPGERGWAHKNLRQKHWDWTEPTEMENGFSAASMVSRKCFYDSGCFDERFFCYAEDDALSLQMRRAGYKIMFEPRAWGYHMEHQSTEKLGNIMDIVRGANATFGKVWGRYLDHNAANSMGAFDF